MLGNLGLFRCDATLGFNVHNNPRASTRTLRLFLVEAATIKDRHDTYTALLTSTHKTGHHLQSHVQKGIAKTLAQTLNFSRISSKPMRELSILQLQADEEILIRLNTFASGRMFPGILEVLLWT